MGGSYSFSGKISGSQWVFKRNLLPEQTSLAEQDTCPGATHGEWEREKRRLIFPGSSPTLSQRTKSLDLTLQILGEGQLRVHVSLRGEWVMGGYR